MAIKRIRPIRNDGNATIAEVEDQGGGDTVSWDDITGKPSTFSPPAATTDAVGGVKQAATQADSTATDVEGLVTDFNDLLAKLKAAGTMA